MSQDRRGDAEVFKTEYQDGDHDKSTPNSKETSYKTNPTSHNYKE
jgi:hypothetical protein